MAAAEDHWRNPSLPPIGRVDGPSERRMRIGLVLDTVNGVPIDQPTRDAVERVGALLEQAGHIVEPFTMPFTEQFPPTSRSTGRCWPISLSAPGK